VADETHLLRKTLKLVKLFEGFSEDDVRDFFTWARRRDAEPGERVMEEGELSHEMYIVASGSLKVVKSRGSAEEELALLEPGDSFGEIALLDSGQRSASVVAVTQSMLLRFERKFLVKIPHVSLKLYRNLAAMMAVRLRDVTARATLGKAIEPNAPAGGIGVPAAAEVVEKKAE